ncbi:MAG: hypothetical protein OK474_03860 [Thaumarchaeota archaeon]|nr:hypothetical protein [Nitrososphaerota archaeon]
MIPDTALVALVFSILAMAARFGRIAKALMAQFFGKNLIGSLRNGHKSTHPPRALPSSQ